MFTKEGFRDVWFLLDDLSIIELKRRWTLYITNSISEYPQNSFFGKGIVICGCGVQYLYAHGLL